MLSVYVVYGLYAGLRSVIWQFNVALTTEMNPFINEKAICFGDSGLQEFDLIMMCNSS